MAGLSGKSAWLAAAKQSAKGTAATTPTVRSAFSGGNIGPRRETDRLAETDSSRDQSAAYATQGGVEGSPEVYARVNTVGLFLHAVLGSTSTSGTMPNFTHTMTPGNTLPYLTMWKNVGGATGLFEKYTDCLVSSVTLSADAGGPLTAAMGVQGLTPDRLTVDPAFALALDNAAVPNFNNAAVTLGGSSTRLVSSFEFTVENNVSAQQTDDFIPYDVAVGTREISLGFDMLFEDLSEYNKFHYGGAAGVAISSNIFTTSAAFTFTLDANNEITITLPSIAYEEFPVEPDPGGDPIVVSARAVAQKATGTPNLVTVTLKNSIASY